MVNRVFLKIDGDFDLERDIKKSIQEYLSKINFQNESHLNRYIDSILSSDILNKT